MIDDIGATFEVMQAKRLLAIRIRQRDLVSAHEALAVILEELEEFKSEVFKRPENRCETKALNELVDIAAACQRAAEDLGFCCFKAKESVF